MKSEYKMNHAWRYTLTCAIGGALVGFTIALWTFQGSATVFGLSVLLGVGSMARLYHYRNLRKFEVVPVKKYNSAAVFIGLSSHFTSFLIFCLLESILSNSSSEFRGILDEGMPVSFGVALFLGGFSMVFLCWVSIPLYMLMGFVTRKMDRLESTFAQETDESSRNILDD